MSSRFGEETAGEGVGDLVGGDMGTGVFVAVGEVVKAGEEGSEGRGADGARLSCSVS